MTKEEQIIAFSRSDAPQWFVMRDLKRNNAKLPAYKMLSEMKIEIFTPMKWKIVTKEKKRIPQKVPFMQDLLFVHVTRKFLILSSREPAHCNTATCATDLELP